MNGSSGTIVVAGPAVSGAGGGGGSGASTIETVNDCVATSDGLPAGSFTAPATTSNWYVPLSALSHEPPGAATLKSASSVLPSADGVVPRSSTWTPLGPPPLVMTMLLVLRSSATMPVLSVKTTVTV